MILQGNTAVQRREIERETEKERDRGTGRDREGQRGG